jgi:hypothetical protein
MPAPSGATPLALQTDGFRFGGCATAALTPFTIRHEGDHIIFTDTGTHASVSIAWPNGFSAWLIDGTAVLYDRYGAVVGREGDVVQDIGGSADSVAFHVCSIGSRDY